LILDEPDFAMIKATHLSLGLAALLVLPAAALAQDNDSAIGMAVHQSVLNQANTIVLRQKLADAQAATQRGDIVGAAKLYQDSVTLAQEIGSGIDAETAQAVAGLSYTSLILARDAQSRGDLRTADVRVKQVLKADPNNIAAINFKKQNDEMLAAMKGRMPSTAVLDQVPQMVSQKVDASTLVQDGKVFYEMGKLEDAEAKLNDALKLDPDNRAAYYYLNLIKQAKYARAASQHTVDTQQRMEQVEKQWVLPTAHAQLPVPNPYATNDLIYTGSGRQVIVDKLNRIRLDNVSYDGLPLSEVLRQLAEQSKLRDPEHKGINFLINPNPDASGTPVAATGQGGFPAAPASSTIDPATGLPVATANAGGGGGDNSVDIGSAVQVKLNLSDVRLADVLDSIVMVAEHPAGHQIKYSIQDFAVVFSDKGAETPQLFMRSFKVDPNTFYSGLESVGSSSYGSVNNSGSGSGSSGGSGGGSGGSGGGSQQNGAVVGVVNAFAGAGGLRNSGGSGGGGGGGGGSGQGASNPLNAGQAGGAGGSQQNEGGLNYITTITLSSQVSVAARNFFTSLGVNLTSPPGKAVFFNDRLGVLFVKATEDDLDTIERAIQTLNQVAPQVHIKSRFIEVSQQDDNAFGFDWYLGQFNIGNNVVGQGGSSGSLTVPVSAANPLGAFPGSTAASIVPASSTDQNITSGLRNALNAPAIGTITGILTNPNFQVALHMLQQRSGTETLAEPEAVTTSGRQTQMRATQIITVITGVNFQQGTAATTTGGTTQ
jgi:tetratricopeptide (TPR) repeat protein